ncbi:MAG TPA: RDD family protein [Candidatus Binatia bacterium]|nr:RDD family protein [Candidatus Binatia bacterium]
MAFGTMKRGWRKVPETFAMSCHYCGFTNDEDDHRCHRCGRRLREGFPPAGSPRPLRTATAPALQMAVEDIPELAATDREPAQGNKPLRASQYQPSLFSSREHPRVVPFETLTPSKVTPKAPSGKPRTRPKRLIPGQQSFGFEAPPQLQTSIDAVIYCDAPVAITAHRVLAAAIDWSLVAIALALFFGTLQFAAGALAFTKHTLPFYAAAAALVAMFYKLLWCMGNGDSPGTRFSVLRLVDFDGRPPTRRQRFLRAAFSCVSFLCGLGLIWALFDEDQLTWQDHGSKTFPTPNE